LHDLAAVWETDTGATLKLSDLDGRVRVISMFYATCAGVCAITREDMRAIEASLSPRARERVCFVLATLDPPHDSVAALRAYRHAAGLSTARWFLLRGDLPATRALAARLQIGAGRDATGRFTHTSMLAVVDESGRVIHQHSGQRANLAAITAEVEAAALHSRSSEAPKPVASDQP
jgi:cytochrome oxidase Cu insertion factor (SCO1/SenC/PrrC family)